MTNSVLKAQLAVHIRSGKAEALRDYLASLRSADFRLAGAVLADKSLWTGCDFWHFASVLVSANNRAYLGTMLKAAVAGKMFFPTEEFVASCTTAIDRRKVLEALLPHASTPADIQSLLQLFKTEDHQAEALLFVVGTVSSYFVLFNLLKQHEDDAPYLRRYGIELIRKGDKHSFNLACIIKEYFALPELPCTFSLALQPYELSRLDTSYDTFLTIINR